MKKVLWGILFLHSLGALAQDNCVGVDCQYIRAVNEQVHTLRTLQPTQPSANNDSCSSFYNKIYEEQSVIPISLALGYYDSPNYDYVYDNHVAYALGNLLLRSCDRFDAAPGACGFTKPHPYRMVYEKRILSANAQTKTVRITIAPSSYTSSTNANRGRYLPRQIERSSSALYFFDLSIRRGLPIVLYYGHSRYGNGPDFAPSQDSQNWGDWNWQTTLTMFRNADKQPKVFGLFSCDSYDHYYEDLRQVAPNTALLLNDGVPSALQNFKALVSSLDSLLARRCSAEFRRALQVSRYARMYNFFVR